MFNSADARTNIKLAEEYKEYSFLNPAVLISPVPYLSWR